MQLIKVLLLFFSVCFTCLAHAGTYYVSTTGTADWADATDKSTPCSAATSLLNADDDDIVLWRGGIYYTPETASSGYTPAFRPTNSGTAGHPITFKAYPGETPFINNSANQGAAHTVGSFGAYYNNYIVWDGFSTLAVVDANNQAKAVMIYQSDYVTIKNCTIEGYVGGSGNNNCVRLDFAEYATIENNKLFNARPTAGVDANCAAIMAYRAYYMTVKNNDIYDSSNAIYDKYDGQNNTYSHNHIYNCDYGFHLNVLWLLCEGTKIYQNILRDISSTYAIEILGGGDSGGSADGFMFYNNVLYDCRDGITTDDSGITNTEIFNNMVVATSGIAFRVFDGTASYYGNNSTTDNFVDSSGQSPEDFKRISYPTDGRGGAYADIMGAYITGNETIGYSSSESSTPNLTGLKSITGGIIQ